jgi:carbamoyltransferase
MLLGLNLSHDSSAALLDKDGTVLQAVQEERFSRIKNHIGIPVQSIRSLLSSNPKIDQVVVGTFEQISNGDLNRLLVNLSGNPSNREGHWTQTYPSYRRTSAFSNTPSTNVFFEEYLRELFNEFNLGSCDFQFMNHHLAHLGCALGMLVDKKTLLISLDGEGDGDSGAVATWDGESIKILNRISALDSLGNLYSAVTNRYNFKPGQHEGKITGLAAYGSYSRAVEILFRHIQIINGVPKIILVDSLKDKIKRKSRKLLGINGLEASSIEELISLAEAQTLKYSDLAYAVQEVLEKSVLEVVSFWIRSTGLNNLSVAGGVFANVKLNQKISEMTELQNFRVFPNMGDGGLSIGGVWAHLSQNKIKIEANPLSSLYLAPATEFEDRLVLDSLGTRKDLLVDNFSNEIWATKCAEDLVDGLVVALHMGKMEFGPRALGNRSILIDPRIKGIVDRLNRRLNRTEFMPFAPVVLHEMADEYFKLPRDITSMEHMTITCFVKDEYVNQLPAITHVDKTARPQIINKGTMKDLYTIVSEFKKMTGFGILVNTSLNRHEEPINFRLADTISALDKDSFDVVYFNNYRIAKVS